MRPFLFEIGPLKIPSYGFMLATAFLIDYYLLHKDLKRRGRNPELAGDLVFWAAIGGIVGSKIYYMIENHRAFAYDPLGMIFSGSGLVFLGGLAGGMLAVTLLLRKKNLPWLEFADIVAPLLILGYAVGRIGCFMVGDDYGVASSLPWAMTFPKGSPPTTIPVHPTQLYETLAGLGIFALLWNLRTKIQTVGILFSIYLILAGTERFLIEFIRTTNKYLFGLSGAQLISIILFLTGSYFIFRFSSKHDQEPAVKAEA
ncbi:MAG: prolipoprotein diacylglyceryl transferase [Candidatus Marinimicrobia bacterium]|nr:prolipoprotein diacylglyceryl transferase [Candidatus Neomarinimicrobiota bacterium]